ncbi:MAG: hypothetical protein N2689_01900 [Verrucomicrobiae bacterium]|nr:hypothetical protein [Verrucomicrobiae bacterium]
MLRALCLLGVLASAAMAAFGQTPTIAWDKAADHVGQLCSVEGQVKLIRPTRESCSLHFSKDAKSDFTVIIYATNAERWTNKIETLYAGKQVCVTGVIRRIAGRPEMVVSDPSQITVLGDAPPATAEKSETAAKTAAATTTNVVETPSPEPPPLLPPFSCDVKRFTGARRGTGGDSAYGTAFRQRIYIELTLQNTTTQPVTDIEWQWVAVVMSVGSASDQYLQGSESQIELKPFEAKTLRSDEIKMAGMTSLRYGQTSGTKFRGHYVRVFYKGHCVFKEGSSPEITQDVEAYLEKQERLKRSSKKG